MTPTERKLIWFLRFTALMLLATAVPVVIPYAWMNAAHESLGLGTLPDRPMVAYVTRSLCALYACLGTGFWYVSRDVKRYLPLLRFAAPVTFLYWATIAAINVGNGMPTWWSVTGAVALLVWTLLLWRLSAPNA